MIRRLDNRDIYKFNNALVILENIHNTQSGNPRFRATIINIETLENEVYTFTGHYMTRESEARRIYESRFSKTI